MSQLSKTNLFKPIKVGLIELKNRVALAPMTRFRADSVNFTANDTMKKHFGDRAKNNGGLLISDAISVSWSGIGYPNGIMVQTKEQAEALKPTVDAVHEAGSFFSAQLFHVGRNAVPATMKARGLRLIGPSADTFADADAEKAAKESDMKLEEMTLDDIEQLKKDFVTSAKNAIEISGADFVEIHGASNYTLAQFADISANKRTDEYGGSIENRSRLMLEVVDALVEAVGAEKVGIKFSPYMTFGGGSGVDGEIHCIAQYAYLYSELERRAKEGKRLAYVSNYEARLAGFTKDGDFGLSTEYSFEWASQIWKGVLVRAGGYLHIPEYKSLIADVNADDRTIIAFGRYFTSNPDLPSRLRNGYPLTPYDRSKFYSPGEEGYNTFPTYSESK
ncbi:unnamed protein product [Ambrosiozyma monospora]|uniref:Unnamed protein product n=1 Tax=Ambrosiozyma monospora TaxID=43982 RepID=A0A9W6Z0M9_AMBMO|nr:unnamed protein product [Ambrosiozyma monospora]